MHKRKRINKDNCSEIGFLKKTHGIQGELLLVFSNGMEDAIAEPEYLFLEVDGLLVPFKVEELAWRGDNTASIRLGYIDSKEEAQPYAGCKVFADNDDLQVTEEHFNIHHLVGFTLIDRKIGTVGPIEEVNDFGGNLVLTVNYKGEEVMIPFNEELLDSFDYENSTLLLECPDGLFDVDE